MPKHIFFYDLAEFQYILNGEFYYSQGRTIYKKALP